MPPPHARFALQPAREFFAEPEPPEAADDSVRVESDAMQFAGDIVFVPEHFGHATLNLAGMNVAVAVEFD